MFEAIASPWIPLAILVILTIYARSAQGSLLAPSAFAGLAWSVYVLVPLAVAPEFPVSSLAVWVILALISSIQVGALITEGKARQAIGRDHTTREPLLLDRMLRVVLVSALTATIGVAYHAWRSLGEYGLSFSATGLLALGHLLSVARYAGESEPLSVRLLLMWVYPAALLGGMAYVLANTRRARWTSFAAFVPALLLATVVAAKAGVLLVACCWLSGFLAMKAYAMRGRYQILNRKTLVLLSVGMVAAILFILVIGMLRARTADQDYQITLDWTGLKVGTLGYLAVFSHWIREGGSSGLGYGAYTFAGLFKMMGLHAREVGLYTVSVTLAGGEETNIYTAFRGLIQDFSLPGAVLVLFIVGLISGSAYRRACQGRAQATLGLSAFYTFLAWSPVVAATIFNGPILAWVVAALVFNSVRASVSEPSILVSAPNQQA